MTVVELIKELLDMPIDAEVKPYVLICTDEHDCDEAEVEIYGDINEVSKAATSIDDLVYIEFEY